MNIILQYLKSRKNFVPLLIRFLMTVPPALLISVKYDSWIYITVTVLYLFFPLFLKKPFEVSERSLIYGCFVAILLAAIPGFHAVSVPERLSYLDAIIRLHLLGPMLIYTACWGFCLKQETKLTSFIIMFCLLVTFWSGDNVMLNDTQSNAVLKGTDWILNHYRLCYLLAAALVI